MSNETYLGSNFLDNRMVHLSSDNGAVRLHDDIILLAIFDNISLLAERMQLRKICQQNMWSVRNPKKKKNWEDHLNLVNGRQVVPRCFNFFNVLDVAFKPQIMSDSIDFTCRHVYATH